MSKPSEPGLLYIVATPIGNLEDISARAIATLKNVDLIAAEDTRHSARLCRHFGIATPMVSLHSFNEASRAGHVISRLLEGECVALVSDAGTPLISDPGYPLVRQARAEGVKVTPVPGPCAMVAALSVAGIPSDRFAFEGFLPAKGSARRKQLESLQSETRTLIFYESPHRILDFLEDLNVVFGDREVVLGREITKTFETFLNGTPDSLIQRLHEDTDQQRGEFVVVVAGAAESPEEGAGVDVDKLLQALIREMPVKKAAAIVADVTGLGKNELYKRALILKGE
ncbi:16S rRNA (cytidine(1402)-2'-O)-methyltransferase [Hahella sp. CCB-MM4]|uniref:16S rRNA (cytidine(1402)-2'-O)-methyltransferase n=1 Tax=Hahella sp. (strain CCB-MM4) TaxID=1926491 RepID=UPI000B9BACDD|nr:16S rRNA (cytidine(1402)-2'-O)-methyltransferase [Hahella sp. CCB-MM4]OZG71994.1 16S rRNA (cytidine(1402)-2'-O)-methyltransferase [Hahella sp. CCB-MM4]